MRGALSKLQLFLVQQKYNQFTICISTAFFKYSFGFSELCSIPVF